MPERLSEPLQYSRGQGVSYESQNARGMNPEHLAVPDFLHRPWLPFDVASGDYLAIADLNMNGFNIYMSDGTYIGDEGPGNPYVQFDKTNQYIRIHQRLFVGSPMVTGWSTNADDVVVYSTGHTGMTIHGGSANNCSIYFADGTASPAYGVGGIVYRHGADELVLYAGSDSGILVDQKSNLGMRVGSPSVLFAGANGQGAVVCVSSNTAPDGVLANGMAMYAADFAAGNACPYFRTENGTVIGLNQSLLTTDDVLFDTIKADHTQVATGTEVIIEAEGEISVTNAAVTLQHFLADMDDNAINPTVGHQKEGFTVDNQCKTNASGGTWNDYGAYFDMGSIAAMPTIATGVDYNVYGAFIKRSSLCVGAGGGGTWNDINAYGIYLEGWKGTIPGDDDAGLTGSITRYALYSDGGNFELTDGDFHTTGAVDIGDLSCDDFSVSGFITVQTDKIAVADTYSSTGTNEVVDTLGAEGGLGIFPEGTYTVTASTVVDASNTWLMGGGWGTIFDASAAQTFHVVNIDTKPYCKVSDLQLYGKAGGGAAFNLLYGHDSPNMQVVGVRFLDGDQYGIYGDNCDNSLIAFCEFDNIDSYAIDIINSNYLRIMGNYFINGTTAIYNAATSDYGLYVGNVCANGGIYALGQNNPIVGNVVVSAPSPVYGIAPGNYGPVVGNTIAYNYAGMIMSFGSSVAVGNTFFNSTTNHLNVTANDTNQMIGLNTFTIAGNNCDDIVFAGANDNSVVFGNVFTSAVGKSERAINFVNTDSCVVAFNKSADHDTAFATLGAGSQNNFFFGNTSSRDAAYIIDNSGVLTNMIWNPVTSTMLMEANCALELDCADGVRDNLYVLRVLNQEATDDRSFGAYIQAGSTVNDYPLRIYDHDAANELFHIDGAGDAWFTSLVDCDRMEARTDGYFGTLGFQTGQIIDSGGTLDIGIQGDADLIQITAANTVQVNGNLGINIAPGTIALRATSSVDSTHASYIQHSDADNPYGLYLDFTGGAPNDATRLFLQCHDTVGNKMLVYSNGGIANFQANNVNLSDEMLKQDFDWEPESQWDFWKELPIGRHRYKDQTDDRLLWGSTAQKIQAVAPELVGIAVEADVETAQKELLGIYEQQLEWRGRKVLQEAQTKIEELEARIAKLEGN